MNYFQKAYYMYKFIKRRVLLYISQPYVTEAYLGVFPPESLNNNELAYWESDPRVVLYSGPILDVTSSVRDAAKKGKPLITKDVENTSLILFVKYRYKMKTYATVYYIDDEFDCTWARAID